MAKNHVSDILKKYKAIVALVENDNSGSEWDEAGMWNAVMKIVKDEATDFSAKGIDKLIHTAKNY